MICYFCRFVDDSTRMTWSYLLRKKSDVFGVLKIFHAMIRTQYDVVMRVFRLDNGGEYVNHEFQNYFAEHGLWHETTCPRTPQQNGVGVQFFFSSFRIARAMLMGTHMPQHIGICHHNGCLSCESDGIQSSEIKNPFLRTWYKGYLASSSYVTTSCLWVHYILSFTTKSTNHVIFMWYSLYILGIWKKSERLLLLRSNS